jgi:hypothetical protein
MRRSPLIKAGLVVLAFATGIVAVVLLLAMLPFVAFLSLLLRAIEWTR